MYFLTLFLGICCIVLLWLCQSRERDERYRKYRRLFHAALENLNAVSRSTAPLTYISATLGRESRKCDIPVGNGENGDPTVSRVHALLEYEGGQWNIRPQRRRYPKKLTECLRYLLRYIRNAQGYTQVFINRSDTPIGPQGAPLRYGDVIQIGGQRLRLIESPENSTTMFESLREKPKYFLLLLLTESFLVLLSLYVLQYAPENQASYIRCMLLIGGLFALFEILMLLLGSRFHRFHCLSAAVTLLLGMGTSYQHLLGYVGTKYFGLLAGFYVMAIIAAVAMNRLFWNAKNIGDNRKIFTLLMASAFVLLVLNSIFGRTENGAQLWVGPVQISELLKPILILTAAMSYRNRKRMFAYSISALTVILMLLIWHDFGDAVILFAVWWVAVFILMDSRILNWSIAIVAVAGFVFLLTRFPYARDRMAQCFHAMSPDAPEQQRDILLSVLFAGLRGLGLDNLGIIKNIYSVQADVALAGIWAVFGIAFLMILLAAYMLLIRQAIQNRSVYPAGHLILTQSSVMITCQILLNFCGSLDLLPFTGIVSPLVSLGGSSLLCMGLLIGMMEAAMNPSLPSET